MCPVSSKWSIVSHLIFIASFVTFDLHFYQMFISHNKPLYEYYFVTTVYTFSFDIKNQIVLTLYIKECQKLSLLKLNYDNVCVYHLKTPIIYKHAHAHKLTHTYMRTPIANIKLIYKLFQKLAFVFYIIKMCIIKIHV